MTCPDRRTRRISRGVAPPLVTWKETWAGRRGVRRMGCFSVAAVRAVPSTVAVTVTLSAAPAGAGERAIPAAASSAPIRARRRSPFPRRPRHRRRVVGHAIWRRMAAAASRKKSRRTATVDVPGSRLLVRTTSKPVVSDGPHRATTT